MARSAIAHIRRQRPRIAAIAATALSLVVFGGHAPNAMGFGQLGGVNLYGGAPSVGEFQLDVPNDIVRLQDGSFLATDALNNRVVKLDSSGLMTGAFGGPTGNGSLSGPWSMALYNDGVTEDVLVTAGTAKIKRFHSDGSFVSVLSATYGGGAGQIASIGGLAVDPNCGELFVSDVYSNGGVEQHRVQRLALGDNPSTPATESFGTPLEQIGVGDGTPADRGQDGKFWYPRGLALSADGKRLFVADNGNFKAKVFKATGDCDGRTFAYEAKFGSNSQGTADFMNSPSRIAVDQSVNPVRVYVTHNWTDSKVKIYTTADPNAGPPYEIPTAHREWGSAFNYGDPVPSGPGDLGYPNGIVAKDDAAWVVEGGNNRIHPYTDVALADPFVTPTSLPTWGTDPTADGYLRSPGVTATALDGSVYVADNSKYRIQHFSPRGALLGAWGSQANDGSDGTFKYSPGGLAVTPGGDVLVADAGNGRIQRFAADGTHLENITWTPTIASPNPIYPGLLDVDPSGDIWVFDWGNTQVVRLHPDGTVVGYFGTSGSTQNDGTLYQPADLVVSDDGKTVFVVDQSRHWIKKFTSSDGVNFNWSATSSAGKGSADGQLDGPHAIELDSSNGELLVADGNNNRVQRLSTADFSFIGKFGDYGFAPDQMITPTGLASDHWGNLWVTDGGNDAVKRFGDSPAVTITAPPGGTTTTAESVTVDFEVTDPAADCDRVSGTSTSLAYGSNTITVNCTNAQGSGGAAVTVVRSQPAAQPNAPQATKPSIGFSKKLRLSRSGQLTFNATCPAGCTITGKVAIGKRTSTAGKRVALKPSERVQRVRLRLSKSLAKRVRSALKKKRKVTLAVTLKYDTSESIGRTVRIRR